MFQKILVAVDGSEHAKQAVAVAGAIAKQFGAQLLILHTMKRIGSDRVPSELKELARIEHIEVTEADALRGVAEAIINRAKDAAELAGATNVETTIDSGNPADRVIACCEDNDVDLVVLGRRGLSDVASMFMGSVSHKVTQLAPCPCLTVPGATSAG